MQNDDHATQSNTQSSDEPLNYTDDTRVMRYLLHNIKGISPVSGGEMEEDLVPEFIPITPEDEGTVS